MPFDSSLSNPLLFIFLYTKQKKECTFNLGGLKKQNRLWHCHANNKTGWHVDSFKLLVEVHTYNFADVYPKCNAQTFFCPVFRFSMSGGTKHQKLDWHKRFSIFWNPLFCFSCSCTQKLSSGYLFQILCCKNTKKGLPNTEKVGANDIFAKKLSSEVATKI